jgi:hypothetical protein
LRVLIALLGGLATALGILAMALFWSLVARADEPGGLPDPRLTPGEVRTTSKAAICGTSTRTVRHVTSAVRTAAWRAYGLRSTYDKWCGHKGPDGRRGCEGDHLCPLGVGCDNKPKSRLNYWPQRPDGPYGFHAKDRCEDAAHRAICKGKITPKEAQAIFLVGNWKDNCDRFMSSVKAR